VNFQNEAKGLEAGGLRGKCASRIRRLEQLQQRATRTRSIPIGIPVIRLNCIRDHVITLQRVHNGDGDRPAAGS
jgi:hypothetical protein